MRKEKEENGKERINKITQENFPGTWWEEPLDKRGVSSTYARNENRCTAKHIVKHQNTEDKKKTPKEKENTLDKGARTRMPLSCSTAVRQQCGKAFRILKEDYFNLHCCTQPNYKLSLSSQWKHFQSLKKFTSYALFLKKLLEKVLH